MIQGQMSFEIQCFEKRKGRERGKLKKKREKQREKENRREREREKFWNKAEEYPKN